MPIGPGKYRFKKGADVRLHFNPEGKVDEVKDMQTGTTKFLTAMSHMPKGATQTPKGDLGNRRVAESDAQKGFKNPGGRLDSSACFGSRIGQIG